MSKTLQPIVAAALFLLSGCGGIVDPTDLGNQNRQVGGPGLLHSNHEHYRVTQSSARAQSRHFTIQARALLGRDGNTVIELTTGTLDSNQPAPGDIERVTLKAFDASGDVILTRHYRHLAGGGTFTVTLPNLFRFEQLQADVRVEGPEECRRGDNVRVRFQVLRRPDLAAGGLDAPPSAPVGSDVSIGATVRELNGDVGAHADCLLLVDGVVTDSATGIWIDAGDTVSCRFLQHFGSAGTHTIAVQAANVVPYDDDPSNNTVTGSINITSPTVEPFHYSAAAQEHAFSDEYTADGWFIFPQPTQDFHDHTINSGFNQTRSFSAFINRAVTFPLTHVGIDELTDGTNIGTLAYDNLPADVVSGDAQNGSSCAFRSLDHAFFSVCEQNITPPGGTTSSTTTLLLSRDAGSVSYHSDGYSRVQGLFDMPGAVFVGGYWVWNFDQTQSTGIQAHLGASYDLNVGITDGANVYTGQIHLPLTATDTPGGFPYDCQPFDFGMGGIGQLCQGETITNHDITGSGSGVTM